LSFGCEFNQSLEGVTLPSSLQTLSFGENFNQSLERVTLPWSLQRFSAFRLDHDRIDISVNVVTSSSGCA
jgi:hypothetical protein